MIIISKNQSDIALIDNILASLVGDAKKTVWQDETIWMVKHENEIVKEAIKNIQNIAIYSFQSAYPLVSNKWRNESEIIVGKNEIINHQQITFIAGPCAVESEEQMESVANALYQRGIKMMRGGAFKPRTSPYSFQGLGKRGLELLKSKAVKYDLKTVTELLDVRDLDLVASYSDIIQIGARNMYNYELLKELGKSSKPILLKKHFSATINEWLLAAEYILSAGNPNVILCERGVRGFETETRNTLDVSAIALCKELTHLPVIADPSQASGKSSLVLPLSMAAIAAGADGLIVEVHPDPANAMSDGYQSLNYSQLDTLLEKAIIFGESFDKKLDLKVPV